MSLRFVSGRAFLDEEAKFEWVMPPFIAAGSSMMLYGRQGLGKSSLMAQLVHSVGTGEPWMGFPVHRTGKSVYLGLDMTDAETQRWLERCENAGLDTVQHIILPRPEAGAESMEFNVLNAAHAKMLREICKAEQPVLVIVDAIQDSYEVPTGGYDVNALIRDVLKAYRRVIGDAVLVFLNHERKGSAFTAGEAGDDDDAFMGGGAWEQKVAASLRLKHGRDNKKHLRIKKTRIDKAPMSDIALEDAGHGFFRVLPNMEQMLMLWPLSIADTEQRLEAIRTCTTQIAVFRSIAAMTGEKLETVKKACQRARQKGVHFPWLELVEPEPE